MSEEVKKYLWDIMQAISRLELATASRTFDEFNQDVLLVNAVERNFEIIGEALKRVKQIQPDICITDYIKIIGMRNIIAHNYDGVEPITLWGTIKRNVPLLKSEIEFLLKDN